MIEIPLWFLVALAGVSLGVLGTLFDKYLLTRYFGAYDDETAGPGALLIFSAYFAMLVVAGVFVYAFRDIDYGLIPGILGLSAGVLNGAWILCYLYAINRADISQAVPVLQIVPAFGLVFGYIMLNEVLTVAQIGASAVILFGAFVLLHKTGERMFSIDRVTFMLMISAAAMVALSQTLFKIVSSGSGYMTATFWLWSGFSLLGVAFYFCIRSYRLQFNRLFSEKIKAITATNSFNEVFDNLGELVFFAAVIIGPLALVQSVNAYEPLLLLLSSALVTRFFPKYFDEDLSRTSLTQKISGIIVITIGSILLYTVI